MSSAQAEDTPLATDLLAAARAGDGAAFQTLVGPHLRALHVHAYRMLGSLDDADEALQDALLNAAPSPARAAASRSVAGGVSCAWAVLTRSG